MAHDISSDEKRTFFARGIVCRASGMPAQVFMGHSLPCGFVLVFLSHSDGGVVGLWTGRLPQWFIGQTQIEIEQLGNEAYAVATLHSFIIDL